MVERERVVAGLDCCYVKQNCTECPWAGGNACIDRLHLATLELLKDEPLLVLNITKFNCYHGDCPACGERIHYKKIALLPVLRKECEVGMFDRTEVINSLEREIKRIRKEPKRKMLGIFMTVDEAEGILELLKEQKPVKPIRMEYWWKCSLCGGNIVANMKHCPGCGNKVDWSQEVKQDVVCNHAD